jgi:hypothetical protein
MAADWGAATSCRPPAWVGRCVGVRALLVQRHQLGRAVARPLEAERRELAGHGRLERRGVAVERARLVIDKTHFGAAEGRELLGERAVELKAERDPGDGLRCTERCKHDLVGAAADDREGRGGARLGQVQAGTRLPCERGCGRREYVSIGRVEHRQIGAHAPIVERRPKPRIVAITCEASPQPTRPPRAAGALRSTKVLSAWRVWPVS